MKKSLKNFCFLCIILVSSNFIFAQKVSIEDIKKQCTGIPYDKRINLSVSSFDVASSGNPGMFGDELAQMLTNALEGISCFNVRLSIKDMKAIADEQQFQAAGNTDITTNNQTGKIQSSQVIVMGKVTEFSSGEKHFSVLGVSGSGGNKAHVGFIIQLINATTGMLIDSRSINVDGKMSGFSGAKLFGVELAGGTRNRSLQDACEKGIEQAVEFIGSKKDEMPLPNPNSPVTIKTNSNIVAAKTDRNTVPAKTNSAYQEQNVKSKTGRHINLFAPQSGSEILVASADTWKYTIDGKEIHTSITGGVGKEAVYGFKDERSATFDTFTMLIAETDETNVKEFELFAGNDKPTGSFEPIGKFKTQNMKLFKTPYQEFKFSAVTAKYLKVKLLSIYSDDGSYPWIYEFQLFGRLE